MVLMNEGLESLQAQIAHLTAMVEENRNMLKSIQRRARISILISSIKWLFILGVTFGSFFFLQPYIDSLMETYSSISGLPNSFSSEVTAIATSSENQVNSLVNTLRAYMPR